MDVALDMETRDPDDVLTLCLIATHPTIRLVSVTVNPGTSAQIGVIRAVLDLLEIEVPIGARTPASSADAVSPFHRMWLGDTPSATSDGIADEQLAALVTPETVLLTAAPLHNLRLLLRNDRAVVIGRWFAQGGFAGDNVVPEADRLAKFAGQITAESYNFGHDPKGALLALTSERVRERRLVSKNVTHKVAWDTAMHDWTGTLPLTRGAALARDAMSVYLQEWPEGKLLHDPLAAAAVLDLEAFRWAEVEVFREQGRWGSRPHTGTNTFVTVSADSRRALEGLLTGVVS